MKARDWVRLGWLYLNDGVWVDGARILPEGWSDYSSAPSPTADFYGAQWWLGTNPAPYYYMSGFRQQMVVVFPTKDLVVARFSMPKLTGGGFDMDNFLVPIGNAFPDVRV